MSVHVWPPRTTTPSVRVGALCTLRLCPQWADSEVWTAVLAGAVARTANRPRGVLRDPRGLGEPAPADDEPAAGKCRERGSKRAERSIVQRAGRTGGVTAGRRGMARGGRPALGCCRRRRGRRGCRMRVIAAGRPCGLRAGGRRQQGGGARGSGGRRRQRRWARQSFGGELAAGARSAGGRAGGGEQDPNPMAGSNTARGNPDLKVLGLPGGDRAHRARQAASGRAPGELRRPVSAWHRCRHPDVRDGVAGRADGSAERGLILSGAGPADRDAQLSGPRSRRRR
jgi:hypothetical protein